MKNTTCSNTTAITQQSEKDMEVSTASMLMLHRYTQNTTSSNTTAIMYFIRLLYDM